MNDSELQIQAQGILNAIAFTPFDRCQPLSRATEPPYNVQIPGER